jgi:hypothetical protein
MKSKLMSKNLVYPVMFKKSFHADPQKGLRLFLQTAAIIQEMLESR